MVAIVDYGAGNLASVRNALGQLGCDAVVCQTPEQARGADRLILPGVGSFRLSMEALEARGWPAAIHEHVGAGRPFLGICLGMQLLFSRGTEHGETQGLGLIPGEVVPLEPGPGCKVPHVGWNSVAPAKAHPLFDGVKPHVDFYFVHSYHGVPADPADVLATCDFGTTFVACVSRANVAGLQFHPEKSQPSGIRMLENFLAWTPAC